MARFKVISFLESYRIEYVTQGSNVKKGNVNIECPFCGTDPSKHMGIDPTTGFWGCWRNDTHRGRSPVRLIRELIHCSYAEACRIAGVNAVAPVEELDVSKIADGSLLDEEKETDPTDLDSVKGLLWPEFCRQLKYGSNASIPFLIYLQARRFSYKEVEEFSLYYNLRYVIADNQWKNMIILPMYLGNCLVSWVGRSIKNVGLRYRALEKELSSIPPKEFLFNFHRAQEGGRRLYIVEGPFDALKLDWYGKDYGCRAVGLMSMNVLESQIYWLQCLAQSFEEVVILLDSGEIANTTILLDKLAPLGEVLFTELPKGVKDPGDLTRQQVINLCERVL